MAIGSVVALSVAVALPAAAAAAAATAITKKLVAVSWLGKTLCGANRLTKIVRQKQMERHHVYVSLHVCCRSLLLVQRDRGWLYKPTKN